MHSLAPTATPTPQSIGSGGIGTASTCSFLSFGSGGTPPPVTVPGNYALYISEGFVSGTTYTQSVGEWAGFSVSGTPAPTPVPTPTATATAVPSGQPTPISYDVYTGQYRIGGYNDSLPNSVQPSAAPTQFTVSTTVGCAILIVTADRSPIATAVDPTPTPTPSEINSETIGVPNFGDGAFFGETGQVLTELDQGDIQDFNLTNLTASGGTATFFLNGAPDEGASVTFGPAQVYTEAKLRALKARFARLRTMTTYRR
jgi:hypothetical protein